MGACWALWVRALRPCAINAKTTFILTVTVVSHGFANFQWSFAKLTHDFRRTLFALEIQNIRMRFWAESTFQFYWFLWTCNFIGATDVATMRACGTIRICTLWRYTIGT